MARDRSPKCKQCRREGMKLFLKGERCLTEKCAIERRSYPPGEHGRGRIKQSEYLLQLREKQKARRYYGLLETQFRNYYEKANKQGGVTGDNIGCSSPNSKLPRRSFSLKRHAPISARESTFRSTSRATKRKPEGSRRSSAMPARWRLERARQP